MATNDVKTEILDDDKMVENVAEKSPGSDHEIEATAGGGVAMEYDEKETRRILSKVDYRLVPVLSILYLVAFIDRSNSKSSFPSPANSMIRCHVPPILY